MENNDDKSEGGNERKLIFQRVRKNSYKRWSIHGWGNSLTMASRNPHLDLIVWGPVGGYCLHPCILPTPSSSAAMFRFIMNCVYLFVRFSFWNFSSFFTFSQSFCLIHSQPTFYKNPFLLLHNCQSEGLACWEAASAVQLENISSNSPFN